MPRSALMSVCCGGAYGNGKLCFTATAFSLCSVRPCLPTPDNTCCYDYAPGTSPRTAATDRPDAPRWCCRCCWCVSCPVRAVGLVVCVPFLVCPVLFDAFGLCGPWCCHDCHASTAQTAESKLSTDPLKQSGRCCYMRVHHRDVLRLSNPRSVDVCFPCGWCYAVCCIGADQHKFVDMNPCCPQWCQPDLWGADGKAPKSYSPPSPEHAQWQRAVLDIVGRNNVPAATRSGGRDGVVGAVVGDSGGNSHSTAKPTAMAMDRHGHDEPLLQQLPQYPQQQQQPPPMAVAMALPVPSDAPGADVPPPPYYAAFDGQALWSPSVPVPLGSGATTAPGYMPPMAIAVPIVASAPARADVVV